MRIVVSYLILLVHSVQTFANDVFDNFGCEPFGWDLSLTDGLSKCSIVIDKYLLQAYAFCDSTSSMVIGLTFVPSRRAPLSVMT